VGRRLFPLVTLAAALTAMLGVGELLLRAVHGSPPRWTWPQERYQSDPTTGVWLRPSQLAFTHGAAVATNSAGIRDAEYAARPSAGMHRVLALGDSQTFGNGLGLEATWPKQLEAELNARGRGRYEVLNAGIPSTDTWQHEVVLERLVERYRPDTVLLAVYVNDVQRAVAPADLHPANAGALSGMATARLKYLVKRSALGNAAVALGQRLAAVRDREPAQELAVLAGHDRPDVTSGWTQVRRSLLRMRQLAQARGAQFAVVALPHRAQVSGSVAGRAYNERLAAIGVELDLVLVDMLGPLREAWSVHGAELFIPWDGHQSALANSIVARQLATRLAWPAGRDAAALAAVNDTRSAARDQLPANVTGTR
jgi:lysophospholipase L1-like esterase